MQGYIRVGLLEITNDVHYNTITKLLWRRLQYKSAIGALQCSHKYKKARIKPIGEYYTEYTDI